MMFKGNAKWRWFPFTKLLSIENWISFGHRGRHVNNRQCEAPIYRIIANIIHESPEFSRWCVGFISHKVRVRIPGQASKKTSLRRFLLSRFLAKSLRVNNLPWKSFSKICRSESTLNCRSRHLCIKLMHTTWVVWEARP